MFFGISSYKEGKAGRISLDRPKALHTLDRKMCKAITDVLIEWVDDPDVEFVLVDHKDGTRGFCAGGDIAMLSESGQSDSREAHAFFEAEYRLNSLIADYPKPYIAIMDGVTMGGGVGLAVHGSHQVATEKTVLAMPETGIGLFPDVGGSWFLPRLDGELGTWLALTGARLTGSDVLAVGLATHYCESAQLSELKRNLCRFGLEALTNCRTKAVFSLAHRMSEINELFAGDRAAAIRLRLEQGSKWARSQAVKMAAKSPRSTTIALRQIRTGQYLSTVQDALRLEYRIATRLVRCEDFHEGVRARIVDKDNYPLWQPNSLKKIGQDDVAKYFLPLASGELQFLEV